MQQEIHTGILDGKTISDITHAEIKVTNQFVPAKGGPTAQAQQHSNEPINSKNLHDITEGEKKVTGGERVAGGPRPLLRASSPRAVRDRPPESSGVGNRNFQADPI